MLPVCSATQCCSSHSQGRKTPYLLMSSLRFSEKEMAFLILGEPLGFAMQDRYQVIVMDADGSRSKGIARSLRKLGVKRPYLVQGGFQSWVKQGIQVKELKPETVLTILNEGFAAASYALLGLHICFLMDRLSITFQEQLPKMLKSSVVLYRTNDINSGFLFFFSFLLLSSLSSCQPSLNFVSEWEKTLQFVAIIGISQAFALFC
eukprot:XP_024447526.1 uncharacterized protein LOC112325343 isoform X4 [Populus trichocarpa]